MPVGFVDEDADLGTFVESIVVVDVDATDGLLRVDEVNHQAELFLRVQVVVVQQELLDVEQRVGRNGSADAPHGAVVFPVVNQRRVFRLGATECYRVVLDEHG